jgi:hypothetical protein
VAAVAEKSPGRGAMTVVQMVSYAISHRLRVQILIVLQEGVYSPAQVADIIGEPLNSVSNHMLQLVEKGSIEIVDTRMRRNTAQHFYRATQVPEYSKEEVEAMTTFEAQVTAGLVIQSLLAEVMASLAAGKMSHDPNVCLVWDRLNLDEQGQLELIAEQEASWLRQQRIEERSLIRAAGSDGKTKSHVTALLGFGRALKAPQPTYSRSRE